ncbi:MAG: hypothetical protein Q9221_005632 [Calogaya cf. arnoldii]
MVSGRKVLVLLGLAALSAAQCRDYWMGSAPFCNPDSNCRSTHQYNGIRDTRGDGAPCWTGKKKLCQCIAPGGSLACTPTLPPRTLTILKGWVTLCNNNCKIYICGVKFFRFWKRELPMSDTRQGSVRGLLPRRLLPCEDAPEQIHCQPTDPDPEPLTPPNEISSTPLTATDVLSRFQQTEIGALTEQVAALGQEITGMSREQLVDVAYGQFTSTMASLAIERVDPKASFGTFEQGPAGWKYVDGPAT